MTNSIAEMEPSSPGEGWHLIDPQDFVNLLKKGLDKVLVIDSRSFLEFNTSRIQQSVNVCCSKLVKRRLQQDKVHISDLLTQTCHIDIEEYSDVIVYDQCTESPHLLTEDNFLIILLRKLVSFSALHTVALLKGGFLAFNAMHPTLCENKNNNNYKCTPLTSLSQPCLPVSNVGPTRILPFLYLGSHRDAMSQETIQVNDISYILNVSTTCPKPPFIQEGHFFRIPVNDNYSAKLLPFFEQAFQFLDKVREGNGSVMVHCLAGISRSPTLAIAYVMKYLGMSSDDAYRYVKDKRPTISPNFNFLGQLLEYEKSIKQEEENLKNRRNSGEFIGEGKIIPIVMDLCSPSSPVAKVTKPFPSDLKWTPNSTTHQAAAVKRDTNDNLPLLADSDTWGDYSYVDEEKQQEDKQTIQPRRDDRMDVDICVKPVYLSKNGHVSGNHGTNLHTFSSHTSTDNCDQYASISDRVPSTPSSEMPPFPYNSFTLEDNGPQSSISDSSKIELKRKSPSLSPVSRSFTLSLSPVSLPSHNQDLRNHFQNNISNQDFTSVERKRSFSSTVARSPGLSRSPGKSFMKPFSLPLSPVISPDNEDRPTIEPKQLFSATKNMETDIKGTEHDLKSSNKTNSSPSDIQSSRKFRKPLSLSISPVVSSETPKAVPAQPLSDNTKSNPSQVSHSDSDKEKFNSSQCTQKNSPFVLPVSPVVSTKSNPGGLNIASYSSSTSPKPRRSPSRSFVLPISPVNLTANETQGSKKQISETNTCVSEISKLKKLPSPMEKSEHLFTLPFASSITKRNEQEFSKSQMFNVNVDNSVLPCDEKRDINMKCTTELADESKPANLPSPSAASPNTEVGARVESPQQSVPKSHKFAGSNNRKYTSQTMYSPSTALAQLHFGQSVAETVETIAVENRSKIHSFPSTSLDKLNFTPCFAKVSESSKLKESSQNLSPNESTSNATDTKELLSPLSIGSAGSSVCSSTVTSPSANPVKVILRSNEHKAKRSLIRPNSIAFSKYPTFDLGSDCQESPSSGSSTSQDDASEAYMLQNGKRHKHSEYDEKFRHGKYSEREVYRQITAAMESAMFRTQAYEASRKARSLDDILSSADKDASNSDCSPFGKLPRNCPLGSDRYTSSGMYDTFCRCRGSSDPYQSNSSISSSGSHSSLHGSLEIIQGGECPHKRRKTSDNHER